MFQFSSCSKFHMIYTNRVYSNQAGVRSNAFLYFSLKASIYFYNLSSLVCSLLMESPFTDVSELIVEIRKHMLDIVRVVHVFPRLYFFFGLDFFLSSNLHLVITFFNGYYK